MVIVSSYCYFDTIGKTRRVLNNEVIFLFLLYLFVWASGVILVIDEFLFHTIQMVHLSLQSMPHLVDI